MFEAGDHEAFKLVAAMFHFIVVIRNLAIIWLFLSKGLSVQGITGIILLAHTKKIYFGDQLPGLKLGILLFENLLSHEFKIDGAMWFAPLVVTRTLAQQYTLTVTVLSTIFSKIFASNHNDHQSVIFSKCRNELEKLRKVLFNVACWSQLLA